MKIFAFCLVVLLSNTLLAQQFDVSVSQQLQWDSKSKPPLKLGDEYFSFDTDIKVQLGSFRMKYAVTLIKYNSFLKVVKETKLSGGEKGYGPLEPLLVRVNDKLFFLYYQYSDSKDQIKIMTSEIDPQSLSPTSPEELVSIDQKNIASKQMGGLKATKRFFLTPSPDRSKVLVLWTSGNSNQVFFSVLGTDLKKIRTASEAINDQNKIVVHNACIDNAGNVFVGFTDSKQENAYILINKQDSKTATLKIDIGQGTPHEVYVLSSITDNLIRIVGTYKDGGDNLAGVFGETLSTNGQLSAAIKIPFPETLVKQFDNDGWANAKAKNYGLHTDLNFVPLILNDGSVTLVGEFRRIEITSKWSYMIAGGILSAHFKKDGVAFSRIPKARVSAGSDIGDSFYPVVFNNQALIFYNDHALNINQDISQIPSRSDNYDNSVLVVATVSEEGIVKREVLIDRSKLSYFPVAEQLQRLSYSSVLVPIRKILADGKLSDDFKWGIIEIK